MIIILLLTSLGLPMVPLGLPMVLLVPTFLPMVTLAPMVPLAAEIRSGFSCYQWYHWLPMVPLVKFPMVPLGEFRMHALSQITILTTSFGNCLFVYHLVLKHLLQNVIRSSFCIPKFVRIGAYKGGNYRPKNTILVILGTLLNKVFGPQ